MDEASCPSTICDDTTELSDIATSEDNTYDSVQMFNAETDSNSSETEISTESDESDIAACCDYDTTGEFYFESERLAYKADDNYKDLVQALVVMKAQEAELKRRRKRLLKCQDEALANPSAFIEELKESDDLCISCPQEMSLDLPQIDWSKYSTKKNSTFGSYRLSHIPIKTAKRESLKRKATESDQSENFRKKWSPEEQIRLEELLLEYPPEDIEVRRWEKIADALGTRTPVQVASRVQKHFIRLMKAGLPVPGRLPTLSAINKSQANPWPPIIQMNGMKDDDSSRSSINSSAASDIITLSDDDTELSDEEDVKPELRNTLEYREIMIIKKVLRKKIHG